jgi:hypothetical protein
MRTPPACLCIPIALLTCMAISCGGNDDARPDESSIAGITAPPANVTTATLDLPVTSDMTAIPEATDDIPLPTPLATTDIPPIPSISSEVTVPLMVEVTVGVNSSPERIDPVPLGATVTLSITNPDSDDEFHLHGYELGDGVHVPAGQPETFTFVADQAGEFELESHETGDMLLTLSVA